jgi:ubiquinone/menaquinone biosynthesis C-methylase UbiE
VPTQTRTTKPYVGLPMEGGVARRYAVQRRSGHQLGTFRAEARALTADLPAGARILEVAPGPGYLAIEMARSGSFHVTGVDISKTFVALAAEAAHREGVAVDFRLGDAADLPFGPDCFDLVVTQAAFKNFSRPDAAVAEMHRVLSPGGTAVIQDMQRDASPAAIAEEVRAMALGPLSAALTRAILRRLRRRARTPVQFERLVAESPFGTAEIDVRGIGLEVRMHKEPVGQEF